MMGGRLRIERVIASGEVAPVLQGPVARVFGFQIVLQIIPYPLQAHLS